MKEATARQESLKQDRQTFDSVLQLDDIHYHYSVT